MSDDQLLKAIAAAARRDAARDVLDPRWDQYSAGTLSDAELEALLKQQSQSEGELLKQAFRPLGEDFQDGVVDQITALEDTPSSKAAAVTPIGVRSRRTRFLAPMALAATLLLALGTVLIGSQPEPIAPLPLYTASLMGGSEFRSTTQPVELAKYQAGDRVEIRLTPATSIAGQVVNRVYAVRGAVLGENNRETSDTIVQSLDRISVEVAPSGATRMIGTIGQELLLIPGKYQLLVAVGREDALPRSPKLQNALAKVVETHGDGWQAWRFDVLIESP